MYVFHVWLLLKKYMITYSLLVFYDMYTLFGWLVLLTRRLIHTSVSSTAHDFGSSMKVIVSKRAFLEIDWGWSPLSFLASSNTKVLGLVLSCLKRSFVGKVRGLGVFENSLGNVLDLILGCSTLADLDIEKNFIQYHGMFMEWRNTTKVSWGLLPAL